MRWKINNLTQEGSREILPAGFLLAELKIGTLVGFINPLMSTLSLMAFFLVSSLFICLIIG